MESPKIEKRYVISMGITFDPNLNKFNCTEDEDIQLLELINRIGEKWSEVSKLISGRTSH